MKYRKALSNKVKRKNASYLKYLYWFHCYPAEWIAALRPTELGLK